MKISRCILFFCLLLSACAEKSNPEEFDLKSIERNRILKNIERYMDLKPITVTDSFCVRSVGTRNDFYSEGDYWWPNPNDLDGPYVRKDGLSNPDNFKAHRKALLRLNHIAGRLSSAYILTKDKDYLKQLLPHLNAWFINKKTKMNPSLHYAQAIKGKVTGRGIGIIDTVHLVEVALAIEILEEAEFAPQETIRLIKDWFQNYLDWLTTHRFGIKERDNGNNHSVCWAVQVAAFSRLVGDDEKLDFCRDFYKTNLLRNQMANNGSFPKELARTKPYGYSLFTLDAMSNLCQLLVIDKNNLFYYNTEDGRSIKKGLEFMYPYIFDKSSWPHQNDVMNFEDWPVRQSALLFGGIQFKNENYLTLWESLDGEYQVEEIERNVPAKYPLLWIK